MDNENLGYSKLADMSEPLRFYELWRGLSNLVMSFIDAVVNLFS